MSRDADEDVVEIIEEDGSGVLLRDELGRLLGDEVLTDVTVLVPKRVGYGKDPGEGVKSSTQEWATIRAHRIILAASSPVLRTMLTSTEFADCGKGELRLGDVDDEAMRWVIDFMYSGRVTVGGAAALLKLYKASDQLQVTPLMKVDPHLYSSSQNFSLAHRGIDESGRVCLHDARA